jgi:plasmid stabilization system protein ParE
VKRIRFIPPAREEFLAKVQYYGELSPPLAERFVDAVESAASRAVRFPHVGAPFDDGSRRIPLRGFPFSLVYLSEPPGIVIIAVAHYARRPGYWQGRYRPC